MLGIGTLFSIGALLQFANAQYDPQTGTGTVTPGIPVEPATVDTTATDTPSEKERDAILDKINKGPTECPEGTKSIMLPTFPPQIKCLCVGTDCPSSTITGDENTIVVSSNGEVTSLEESELGKGILKGSTTSAKYSANLTVKDFKLIMNTSAGERQVNIFPEEAVKLSGTPEEEVITNIDLKEENQEPVYSIEREIPTKLFGIFPVTMSVETKVHAETGEILSVKKPWWGIFAWFA